MGCILKLHDYMDVVGRAKQDARAEEQYFRVCPQIEATAYSARLACNKYPWPQN